jgi:GT2 family glycosyltransferase
MDVPVLSVVIPSHNRASLLEDCIRSFLEQQTDRPYEVIVIDDGSTDDTRERVTRLAATATNLSYEARPASGLNASRNAGAARAKADLIAFIDDDALAPPSYVDALVEGAARHPEGDCFGGRIRLQLEGRVPRSCGRESIGEAELEKGDSDAPLLNAVGANLIVRRSALEKIGPFKADMALYGDEVEWQHRLRLAGGSVVYLANAWIWHRRMSEDLRLRRRVRRSFRKGLAYPGAMIAMDRHVSPWGGLFQLVRGLGHALRFGCSTGLVAVGLGAGHTIGAVRLLMTRGHSPYVHWMPARSAG